MSRNLLHNQGERNSVVKNVVISFGTKIVLMVLNIIIPRLFIVSYGSEVNGLLSTITQIFGYLALLEAGIGTASVNALYKPLDTKDWDKANEVASQSRAYFRKVTLFYVLGVVAFAILYPLVSGSAVDGVTILLVILLQGASNCLTYYFSATYTQLLVADGKNYWVDIIAFSVSVGTSLTKIILVSAGCNVVWVQAGFLAVSLVRIPIILLLCHRQYPWLKPVKTRKNDLLQERGALVVHEISTTIFSGTDVFLISTFCSFALASVYSVYQLVFGALNSMLNTANSGLGFLLGQNYYKDRKKFIKLYDLYSSLYSGAVFVVMTVAYLLIRPFIALYTEGVTDINYSMPGLSFLFVIINLMSGVRAVAARLITVSGHAEKTKYRSIAEAIINLVASVVLVNLMGIYGVLAGTIIALLYRANDIIIYANKVILERNPWHEYKRLLVNTVIFAAIVGIAPKIAICASGYAQLLLWAVVVTLVVTILYSLAFLAMNYKSLKHPAKKVVIKRKEENSSEDGTNI